MIPFLTQSGSLLSLLSERKGVEASVVKPHLQRGGHGYVSSCDDERHEIPPCKYFSRNVWNIRSKYTASVAKYNSRGVAYCMVINTCKAFSRFLGELTRT